MNILAKHNVLSGVWLMEYNTAVNYFPFIYNYMAGRTPDINQNQTAGKEDSPINTPENVRVLNITGVITKHDQECGPPGMVTYARMLFAAYADDTIKGIILKIDSGGGEGTGMRVLMEALSKRNKPVVAFIDDLACSAAYGIASATDYIVANSNMARVGSIGVYLTVADYTEYYKKQGIDIMEIYAPESKDKNDDYRKAIKGDQTLMKQIASVYAQNFIKTVEKLREGKISTDKEIWSTGKAFFADQALNIGLIDNIDTFENTLNYFNT